MAVQVRESRLPRVTMIRMPADMERALKEIADAECDSVSGVVRRLVRAQLNARQAVEKIAV